MDNADRDAPTVVVMTALQSEYRAMLDHLEEFRQEIHPAGTVAEVGRLPGAPWRVALTVVGAGNASAAVLAERMVGWFRPRALLVVGIAGALHDDLEIGDVVVATWVYGYHSGREDDGGFKARPRGWMASHRLEQLGRAVDMSGDWVAPPPPAVHFRPIAAGEVVLNSREVPLAGQLEFHYDDAAAIEMESAGAATAAHLNGSLDALTIRAISDKADGTKHATDKQGLQELAAVRAAAFAAALLRRLLPDRPVPVHDGAVTGGVKWAQKIVGGEGSVFVTQRGDVNVGGRSAMAPAASSPSDNGPAPLQFKPTVPSIPVRWRRDLGQATSGSATLELHLVTSDPYARLQVRRLNALGDELAMLGRARGMFEASAGLQCGTGGDVAKAVSERSGLALTREGQRSAWEPLPRDMLGAVLDEEDVADRLALMLAIVVEMDAPKPEEVGLAVAIDPVTVVSEGRVADLPRSSAQLGHFSSSHLRVPAEDTLPFDQISAHLGDVAEELAARLLAGFRDSTSSI